ncbi:MAG: 4-oxalocrotonate tautomerase [Archaeoglobi archaeon]|nr:2-hydroxymuconate tautomerase family protein [Candidatus Mnemosynella bozhongmuii]MDI3502273.1 4-oxalocrotonate tautomerase [Archaeoglobi archaeon]MDK2781395.1 4-oxalocrotonate tautomerase [Archaeoglobi archaeon]
MPVAQIYVWKGFSDESKRKVIEGITEVFASLEIPKEAVEVIIHEIPKENWGVGGEQASMRFRDVEVP